MKALTISQPFANLIVDGDKFVENRKWECLYRGLLAIHAGKGTQYLTRRELAEYPTGAIIGVCRVSGCVHVATARANPKHGSGRLTPIDMEKVLAHKHTEGPYGIVLSDVVKLDEPIPCNGMLGLWNVPADIADRIRPFMQ